MIFGESVSAADSVAPAEWLGGSCRGAPGTVGALVPAGYESVLRVFAPAPCPEGWWSLYRDLFDVVASVGERHTSSPDEAWFAIWEGHGFDNSTTHIAHRGPLSDDELRALDAERARRREEDRRRHAETRAALDRVPRFERPDRAYFLVQGAVAAVTGLRYPDDDGWRNPDLFWPDDRRWFVATDVDFWSLFVGGDREFITELARHVPTRIEAVTLGHPLPTEV